ncbi:hypothetical protein RhiirA5_503132 [Rhizophagus irregularis]|uniref:Uncharacterized protein n=1 Tax=Rhizophagus irregularis TaxID=588596 RepID=A0A2N0PAN7_9GLOM|nr:hypothetical protein RhiirA5_503132 [Rhizophagus irregularis]
MDPWKMSVTNEKLLRKINNFLDEKELTATIWQRIKSQDLLVGSYLDDDEVCFIQQNDLEFTHLVMCSNILHNHILYLYQLVNYIKETHRNERQEDIKH